MNESGGEDDILFGRIRRARGAFAWAPDAPVWEHPPKDRVTLEYTLKRAFSYGQAPITLARRNATKPMIKTALWMLIGVGKLGLARIGMDGPQSHPPSGPCIRARQSHSRSWQNSMVGGFTFLWRGCLGQIAVYRATPNGAGIRERGGTGVTRTICFGRMVSLAAIAT